MLENTLQINSAIGGGLAVGQERMPCQHCGTMFLKRYGELAGANRFCSHPCAMEYRKARRKPKLCRKCGKEFRGTSRRVFCSKECTHQAAKLAPRTCLKCGREFQPYTSKARYCSRQCFESFETSKCEYCGQEFRFRPNRGANRFCSAKCSREVIRKPCEICGKDFESPRSKNRVCCSQRCAGELLKRTTRKSVKSTSIQRGRLAAVKPLVCARCGYSRVPEIIEMHHIDEDKANDSLNNLEWLCPNCHDEEHFNRKTGRFRYRK